MTASSELGRSCGKMEAYGWRMGANEQTRVNQIFSNTVDRLRGLGYSVESQTPTSVSSDITLFTADRADRHFMFMWSAGEIGLAMVLCESSAPASSRLSPKAPSVQVFSQPNDVLATELQTPAPSVSKHSVDHFTPVGDWVGGYTCMQGYTGGTLRITKLDGENFTGTFKFYPTPKNQSVPSGRYEIYGQYDRASQRILINPGKWLERPPHFFNTIMVGSFDPVARTFSAYFQGINGCTSFEARAGDEDIEALQQIHKSGKVKKTKPTKKKTKARKTVRGQKLAPLPGIAAMPDMTAPAAPASNAPLSIVPDQPPANVAAPVVPPAPQAAPVTAPPAPTAPATPPQGPNQSPSK